MKQQIQHPTRVVPISLQDIKPDKYCLLFFIIGIVLSALLIHHFIL